MAIVIPCIKAKMGNTEYFEAKMPVRELVTAVRSASELDEWASMGIEERMQRDPNLKRIEKEIAPYIVNNEDRFFGSIIVLIFKGEVFFEGLQEMRVKIPAAYQAAAKDIGFLTIDGGSLIVLDGQHRLLALLKALKMDVVGKYSRDIPDDEISVILIKHEDNLKTRRIFNKVNRYARSTSRGDNIITSEDDANAIISRWLLDDGAPFGTHEDSLVNWKSNTLSARSTQLTTISVIYETVKTILKSENIILNEQQRPSDEELDEYFQLAEKYWKDVLEGVEAYKEAIKNPSKIPLMREENSKFSLLLKPAAQIALIKGLIIAKERGLDFSEAVKRVNKADWRITSDIWRDIIVRSNGTIDTKETARDHAANLIAYFIGADKMTESEIKKLHNDYIKVRNNQDAKLPKSVIE